MNISFAGFKERWFKLKYNFLFYHNINEAGQIESSHPSGVIILENYYVKNDQVNEGCFAFGVIFQNQPHKWHTLSGRSEASIKKWITAIRQASYEFWRSKLIYLQKVLSEKTGKDPLLMYPRNEGTVRDITCQQESNFKSHLNPFTLNSSSNVQTTEEKDLIDIF